MKNAMPLPRHAVAKSDTYRNEPLAPGAAMSQIRAGG